MESPGKFVCLVLDEAVETTDGRSFAPNSVTWREPLPLTLMGKDVNEGEGHQGSLAIGAIEHMWRDGSKIYAEGHFSASAEGQDYRKRIEEGTLNRVSADLGGVTLDMSDEGNKKILKGTLMGVTVVPFSAFNETTISLVEENELVAAAIPVNPPAQWFENPNLKGPTPLTVMSNGQVFGHAATWGTCHISNPSGPGKCTTPPHSNTDYSYYQTGSVWTQEGVTIKTGRISLGTGHAGPNVGPQAAVAHYDNTGTAVADVRVGEDSIGIWVAGAVRPSVDDHRLREFAGSAVSGDWRRINGNLEMVGLLSVNVPGFPIPAPKALVASGEIEAITAAGIVTCGCEECDCGVECNCMNDSEEIISVEASGTIASFDTSTIDVPVQDATLEPAVDEPVIDAAESIVDAQVETEVPAEISETQESVEADAEEADATTTEPAVDDKAINLLRKATIDSLSRNVRKRGGAEPKKEPAKVKSLISSIKHDIEHKNDRTVRVGSTSVVIGPKKG
jgi:hypothetical protein